MSHTYVALLRAVNVGGTGKLSMARLAELVERSGGSDVRTYIQSGNVVFGHRLRSGGRVAAELEAALERELGLSTSVLVRTGEELRCVLEENPFSDRPSSGLHVAFLSQPLAAGALEQAGLDRLLPEEVVEHGRELYLFLPHGAGRAKAPLALRRLPVASTMRNWRTVTALAEMSTEDGRHP